MFILKRLWRIWKQHKKQKREGYTIKFGVRSEEVIYREGERSLSAGVSWAYGFTLYTRGLKEWDTPAKGQKLRPEEYGLVLERIKGFLSAYESKITLDDSPGMTWEEYIEQAKVRAKNIGYDVIVGDKTITWKPKFPKGRGET